MKKNTLDKLNLIAQAIYDKKGMNILALDVEGLSSITDCILIAEGNVDRHVIAIARGIMDTLQEKKEKPFHMEGLQTGDWVVLDYSGIMVHLFMPGLREKYCLEKLWNDSKIIDLQIEVDSESFAKRDL
jgi:ribosome-associated protein